MPTAAHPGRLPQLDSLRGLAAVTVVLHHFGLMWPAWVDDIDGPGIHHVRLGLLYPLYAGHEAVMLFFVLSGLVLALPFVQGKSQPYGVFALRRIVRIYGPYLASLALALAGAAIWHGPHTGWARPFWSQPIAPGLVLQHLLFLGVYDFQQFNFTIWSLIIELRISLIFPLLCAFVLCLRTPAIIALALAASVPAALLVGGHAATSATYTLWMTFHYMAFFLFGILLARSLPALRAWYGGLGAPGRAALGVVSVGAYVLSVRIALHSAKLPVQLAGDWGTALGAAGIVILSLNSPLARRLLLSPVATFLGRISYSLYLVHAPILLALTFGLAGRVGIWAQCALYLPITLVVATLFHAVVEQPLLKLGRSIGHRGPMVLP